MLVSDSNKQKAKRLLIFTAALVTPGGFIALGVWKAYQVYKKKKEEQAQKPKTVQEFIDKMKKEIEENPE